MKSMENAYVEMFKKEVEKQGCTGVELLNVNGVKILKVCNADFLMDISEDESDYVASCSTMDDMGDISYGILFGSEFNKFSKETQNVIMYHEIGHAINPIDIVDIESEMKAELLADLYAIEQTSFDTFVNAINESSDYIINKFKDDSLKQFAEDRINNVKKAIQK